MSPTENVPLISANQENHKYNHRNIPAGESFAIMNASKKIGNIFNPERDEHVDVMKDYFKKKNDSDKDSAEIVRMTKMIDAAKSLVQIEKLKNNIKQISSDKLSRYYLDKKDKLTKLK